MKRQVSKATPPPVISRRVEIPDYWQRTAGMDWGYSPNPGVLEIAAHDPFGRIWVYKEIVFREKSPLEVADLISEQCPDLCEDTMTIYGDPAMWTAQAESGTSIADTINDQLVTLQRHITLVPANNDRMNGWTRVHQYLRPRPSPIKKGAMVPWLRVSAHDEITGWGCPYLIDTLPAQLHDTKPTTTWDLKKNNTDHGCDALRYLVMAQPALTAVPLERTPAPTHKDRLQRKVREIQKRQADDDANEGEMSIEAEGDDLDQMNEQLEDLWGR